MSDADASGDDGASEPDSTETKTVNFLIEAMNDGDENRVACALRELANLNGFALIPEVLAAYFDGPRKSKVQPRWLRLDKRGIFPDCTCR
jgi:hypothetical protein